jgi:hypothetical protein
VPAPQASQVGSRQANLLDSPAASPAADQRDNRLLARLLTDPRRCRGVQHERQRSFRRRLRQDSRLVSRRSPLGHQLCSPVPAHLLNLRISLRDSQLDNLPAALLLAGPRLCLAVPPWSRRYIRRNSPRVNLLAGRRHSHQCGRRTSLCLPPRHSHPRSRLRSSS